MSAAPKIVVIGAGVVGAMVAWHLAQAGTAVTLVETNPTAAAGVTGRAFGWINLIHGDPDNAAAYALLRQAVSAHDALATRLPSAYSGMRRGSLLWLSSDEATGNLVRAHQAADATIRLLGRAEIARLEPALCDPPSRAAFSPDDMAVDPVALTRALIAGAVQQGATIRWSETATAIVMHGQRVVGVDTTSGRIDADAVVVAAGPEAESLVAPLGIRLNLAISPVRMLRFKGGARFISHIICAPELEVRQADDGTLLVPVGCDDDADTAADAALHAIRRRFAVTNDITFAGSAIGRRPTFADGLPRFGFVPEVNGLLVAVGHPGVILAPLLGSLVAEEIGNAFDRAPSATLTATDDA